MAATWAGVAVLACAATVPMGRPASRMLLRPALRSAVSLARPAPAPTMSSAAMPAGSGPGGSRTAKFYRTLGITQDATYEEITDAFANLVSQAGDNADRIAQLETARDRILDERLKMRLSGQGPPVRDPLVKPKEKIDWFKPFKILRRYIQRPTMAHFTKMSFIFLGFAVGSLVAPGVGDQMSFFSLVFGSAFVYARGTPEPVRDDFGQVGEILPTKTLPAILAFLVVAGAAGTGYLLAVLYLSLLIPPQIVSIQALSNAMVAFFVWLATCFVKVQQD
mmetsp:Transcript_24982/g.83724  ORF Transcript_24982/g.83724 Transcript_24982/m.83724 type:complete len:278 (-) Transcript_24982:231-1064(-)